VEVKNMRVETKYEREDPMMDSGISWIDPPDMNEFVINTKEESEMELVGGKALNISQLSRKRFVIPEGFCITTKAYDFFMEFNSISEEDAEICDRIRKGIIPPLLAEAICNAYHMYLNGSPCAVRSSSPLEDLENASFAGQYESFLNVKGEDALLDAVKECWASLWGQSVVEYRKRMGISENIKMAVLVQEMVSATASGVLFTEDQMILEAVWGLGNMLVGGKVIPDHFTVEREGFNVVERKISYKEMMSLISFDGGVEVTEVSEQARDTPVLEDNQIRELCVLGTRVEKLFNCPQDIEWALCSDKFVLLQARPITIKQEPDVWSRANLAETQPGYVTYLSRVPENRPDFYMQGIRPLLECFDVRDIPEDLKLTDYIYGHIYANMTAIHNTLGKIPGLSPELLDESMGHKSENEKSGSTPGFSAIVKLLPGAFRIMRLFLHLPEEAEKIIPYSEELIEDIRRRNLQEMNLEELDEMVWGMYDRTAQVFQTHACTALANASIFGVLQKILKRIGEEGTENLLTMGLKGMSSSQLGVEMWKLAESAKKSPRVSELILSREEGILKELEKFPEGITFTEELNKAMGRIGDRCSQELELSVPRWEENPYFVLSMVANYIGANVCPVKTIEEQKKIRQEATGHILEKLSRNPFEKFIFEKILDKTHQFIVARENLKTTWVRGVSAMRFAYLAIAEKLVNRGILKERDDLFYLKMTEVSDIIAGTLDAKLLEEMIRERKKEREECDHLDVPEVVVGKPSPIEELTHTVEPKEQLEGAGCSFGVVTGRARVVFDPSECPDIREGEILVAPVTDPGWTPLFVIARGLVMELGGTLSHGVIIAREYGIPAVVGVKNATKIIKTGQTITVDGNKGIVYIRE
jgi:phosphohistidine swiveling domain-containing protein